MFRKGEVLTFLVLLILFIYSPISAQKNSLFELYEASSGLPHIFGKQQNAEYLYVTAGSRLYCIGNQAGGFPEVGFHVPGEMGGIWQQPIKLLDGFSLKIKNLQTGLQYTSVCDSFIAYSFVTQFHYSVPAENIRITQTQFVPDSLPVLVVEYKIQNTAAQNRNFGLELNTDINLMPVWLGEKSGMIDQADTIASFDKKNTVLYFRDNANSWFGGIGFESDKVQFKEVKKSHYQGKGITGVTSLQCEIPAGKSYIFRFYISGSMTGTSEIAQNISTTKSRLSQLFENKKQRYAAIEKTAEIIIPDKDLETAYNWGKYSTDWLVRDVPGMGQGMSAGLPDYPWFFSNDQASTFMALTGTRDPQLFYKSFAMLKRISDKANDSCGRIIHEVSSNGMVYDKGRMEESQLHIIAAWQIFKWTGNLEFLKENYAFAKRTWKWLQQHDSNQNGYIEGSGGAEIEGLNDEMLDVQLNTYEFLNILSQMATLFGDKAESSIYAQKAEKLKNQINTDWWVESENRYADFISSKGKALEIIDDALAKRVQKGRNNWALTKLTQLKEEITNNTYPNKGYVVYYNPSGLQPMENGVADSARAMQMLKHASFFTNKFGVYITGIDRPDDVSIDENKFQKDTAFSYTRAVMPAATSGLIQASAHYGMPDTALMYIHKTLNSFSFATPGTTYEIAPDYGMFVQAWNVTGINIPLIQYFFGLQPDAYNKEITIRLQMPTTWSNASLNNLLVRNTKISIQYRKSNKRVTCLVSSSEPGWKIHFVFDDASSDKVVNQRQVSANERTVVLSGASNTIQFTDN